MSDVESFNNEIPNNKELNDLQLKFCSSLLTRLKRSTNAGPFLVPVDPVALGIPDYFETIKQPMDLSTVRGKLDKKVYENSDQFLHDMKLIFSNCYTYNGETSPVSLIGKELEKTFDNYFKDLPLTIKKEQKKVKRTVKPIPREMEDYEAAVIIMNEIDKPKNKKVTWCFCHPVSDEEAPGYSSIVKQPMDLSTVRNKLEMRVYSNLEEFIRDLQLIVDNCKLYNPENSDIYKLGIEFEKLFNSHNKNPDLEIEELRKKISDLMVKLNQLEENRRITNRKIYTVESREKIGTKILAMGRDESDKIVEIIQRNCSSFQYVGNDEIEVNMLTLPDHVIGEVEDFIEKLDNKGIIESSSSGNEE
ncbi:hypothetical protein NUSPORA_01444 [Nucleospora cyclopteri]